MNTAKNYDLSILLIRITAGGLMLTHGFPKMMKLFAGGEIQFADPIGIGMTASLALAVFSEVICSFLVLVGYKTRWFAIPLAITMFIAAFVVHLSHPWAKKEMAIIYLLMYLALIISGSGKYSVDHKLK